MIPLALLKSPLAIVSILLALSVGLNVVLFKARDRALRREGAAMTAMDAALAAARSCSDATDRLRAEGDARRRVAQKAVLEAGKRARDAERKASATLQEAPAIPADSCASFVDMSRRKLLERVKP